MVGPLVSVDAGSVPGRVSSKEWLWLLVGLVVRSDVESLRVG